MGMRTLEHRACWNWIATLDQFTQLEQWFEWNEDGWHKAKDG